MSAVHPIQAKTAELAAARYRLTELRIANEASPTPESADLLHNAHHVVADLERELAAAKGLPVRHNPHLEAHEVVPK